MNRPNLRIDIPLEEQPYQVIIGGAGIEAVGKELIEVGFKKQTKILVVTNSDVAGPYAEIVLRSLRECDYDPKLLIIQAGEDQKNLDTISLIYNAAYSAKLERGSLMLALGGGVIGDMTGFAAATWLRGVSFVQVPTTLLAMVDASVGGKTGVNHPKGKNLIGAFHQPKLVLIDQKTLTTLPERELKAGMAEVIKYGVIGDVELFKLLEDLPTLNVSTLEPFLIEKIIWHSVKAKAKIVSLDEKENGIRAILNYGHTFGHVIETLCGYGKWLHGEAVAMGMVAVGELAVNLKCLSIENKIRQKELLNKAGLPTQWPGLKFEDVFDSLKADKKVRDGKIRFVIPKEIGNVEIRDDINSEEIKYCLSKIKQ